MAFLFALMAIGYLLVRCRLLPERSEMALSRLENYLFIPALVLGTFIDNFTVANLSSVGLLLLQSVILALIAILVSCFVVRLLAKDRYTRNIYLYGLSFSNFAFMGNAIVTALFPEIFLEYLLFTLVLWTLIYLWGVPSLLMEQSGAGGIRSKLKSFVNPMFLCMILGMLLGVTGLPVPAFADRLIDSLSACMSPVAMLLTGMTVARINLKEVLKIRSIYAVSLLRLVVYPLAFLAVMVFAGRYFSRTFLICATVSLAMPLGLNTIVIPNAYGKDTRVASGMALVSCVLACVTIPPVFLLMEKIL